MIAGNYIGTDSTGLTAQPNANHGIKIQSASSGNRIGSDNQDASERNVISGNTLRGVVITGLACDSMSINIDSLTEAELIELNHKVIESLHLLHQWRRLIGTALFILIWFFSYGCQDNAEGVVQENTNDSNVLKFEDSFETDKGWILFEEIVDNSSCYGEGIAEITLSTDFAYGGNKSLLVFSNKESSSKSNHVLASYQFANTGQDGTWVYEFYVFIAPETATTGQTGPEFSLQNTRQDSSGNFLTSIAGIQYQSNDSSSSGYTWSIWTEKNSGEAGWTAFLNQPLQSGIWYFFSLEMDYNNNSYGNFVIYGDDVNVSIDLSEYIIAQESKFTEEAFWLTLEAENRWNNCGEKENYSYKIYYDEIKLYSVPP